MPLDPHDHGEIADDPCPECEQGKHSGCWGDAWDWVFDVPAVCPCWAESGAQAGETCQAD